ncbi:leukotriene-A4 hydrolase [Acrasis kona]
MSVTVADPLVAACSGAEHCKPVKDESKGTIKYVFHQPVPIPSYLIALAVGALKRESIGPRSFVWCEQEQLEAAKDEFSQTECFLKAAEDICGMEYKWGTYDLLVLPGAFPYGGMENPNLTFISASLITGNKELTDVIAHEITHSWSGNLVTNSSWPDFWLNEGFTMYIERLILMKVAEQNEKGTGMKVRDFQACLGYGELTSAVRSLQSTPELTKLAPDMRGIDPDDAFSRIPYEKGCLLLLYLEHLVGGVQPMIDWLRKYFVEFQRQSITNKQMIHHFEQHFPNVKVDWNTWLYEEGMGPWNPMSYLDQTMNKQTQALVDKWTVDGANDIDANASDIKWDPAQTMVFLDNLANGGKKLGHDVIKKLDEVYEFSKSKNVEISVRFLRLALENEYVDVLPVVEDFVSKHGRSVYLKPLYGELILLSDKKLVDKQKVKDIYQKNRSYYHSVIRNAFDAKLAH